MSINESKENLKELYGLGKKNIIDFYKDNERLIASFVTNEEQLVLSAYALQDEKDKTLLKSIFPFLSDRKLKNMELRGLFDIGEDLIASTYPLFGKKDEKIYKVPLEDIVKCVISLIETKELNLSEARSLRFFSSPSFISIFPSYSEEELTTIVKKIIRSLEDLEIIKRKKNSFKLDRKKAFELIALDEIRLTSYIAWPKLDEWVRKKSFYFITLLKKICNITEDNIGECIKRASLISRFTAFDPDEIFELSLLIKKDGIVSSLAYESPSGPALISSDYSISIIGSYPALLSIFAEPVKIDRVKEFKITKQSILNAFSNGYKKSDIISFFESLSAYSLSEALKERINIWSNEFSRISIERTLVLKADEKTSKLLKALPFFKDYVIEELADNIFSMDALREDEWREKLKNASFEMLSETIGPEFDFTSFERNSSFIDMTVQKELKDEREIKYDEEGKEELLKAIEEKSAIEHAVKAALVRSGVIIKKEMLDQELTIKRADGFFYMDKHKIIDECLKDKSLVLFIEDCKGNIAAGKVQMLENYEDGDHMILSHKMICVSKIYRLLSISEELL